ncbi:uncharacterized protein LOC128260141 [Drosophila gunungcola]|uniref:uncharacterized protein LOC128260141 n=1 Tax=Drosophila gunungcola TaxID=103775 RepID=UPI0022DF6BDA|nr:uncharacterized protein LOC128260141 [Drosophila gunungcola]
MSDEELCQLCLEHRRFEIDFVKPVFNSTTKLLLKLFESYNVNIEQGNFFSICKQCFKKVLYICESLKKWGSAQENIKKTNSAIQNLLGHGKVPLTKTNTVDLEEKPSESFQHIYCVEPEIFEISDSDDGLATQVKSESPVAENDDDLEFIAEETVIQDKNIDESIAGQVESKSPVALTTEDLEVFEEKSVQSPQRTFCVEPEVNSDTMVADEDFAFLENLESSTAENKERHLATDYTELNGKESFQPASSKHRVVPVKEH